MKKVFADTLYWVAITRPNDQWHSVAARVKSALKNAMVVTTDEVLAEFMNSFCRSTDLRETAVLVVHKAFQDPNTIVVPQTREGFLLAVERFDRRPDKKYSLVDCHSMNVMEAEGIQDVLTNDHHFEQEGFNVLIRR
jgi:predicted nucleic acid-binding protein